MPFRDKVKKAFGKSNDDPSETSSDLSPDQSKASNKRPKKQKVEYPDNVYKPGEIPESKYKGPYDKKHQQKLHAFSFAAAFQGRRKSEQSLYSPMGSRLPSRMGSMGSFISRRSWVARSRQQSRVEDTLMENSEADDAVENGILFHPAAGFVLVKLTSDPSVGMSRRHTRDEVPTLRNRDQLNSPTKESQNVNGAGPVRPRENPIKTGIGDNISQESNQPYRLERNYANDTDRMDGLESTKTLTNDDYRSMSFGNPFSADDLVRAMTQSTLKPSAVRA